jgi:hypothetical protein
MYEYEEVKNDEVTAFAKSIGAAYHETSAKNSIGIDVSNKYLNIYIKLYKDLFYFIGLNILDPELKNKTDDEDIKFDLKLRNNKIILNDDKKKSFYEEKKKCC